jgi:hypothetical protein
MICGDNVAICGDYVMIADDDVMMGCDSEMIGGGDDHCAFHFRTSDESSFRRESKAAS